MRACVRPLFVWHPLVGLLPQYSASMYVPYLDRSIIPIPLPSSCVTLLYEGEGRAPGRISVSPPKRYNAREISLPRKDLPPRFYIGLVICMVLVLVWFGRG